MYILIEYKYIFNYKESISKYLNLINKKFNYIVNISI
jgi:hypothetical protein